MDRLRPGEEEELGARENVFFVLDTLKEGDFQFRLDSKMKRSLKSDEVGICVYPHVSTHFLADRFPPSLSYSLQATFIR